MLLHRRCCMRRCAHRLASALRVALAAGLASIVSCGEPGHERASVRAVESAIQSGMADATDSFVVAVSLAGADSETAACTGELLAPNLVVTARHCVAPLAPGPFACSSSTFGPQVAASDVLVTTDAVVTPASSYVHGEAILVPSGSKVCGGDIALVVLASDVELPRYVVPAIRPPMTDPSYARTIAAIGYGVSDPTDTAGTSAGVRRIARDIPLTCIPNATTFADCYGDPANRQVLAADEFVSGNASTCEGDSGSGAFDETQLDAGRPVSFGVLSRGSISADGRTCTQPIYERFDAFGDLLSEAARQAAERGGYPAPSWVVPAASQGAGCAMGAVPRSAWRATALVTGLLAMFVRRRRARVDA